MKRDFISLKHARLNTRRTDRTHAKNIRNYYTLCVIQGPMVMSNVNLPFRLVTFHTIYT